MLITTPHQFTTGLAIGVMSALIDVMAYLLAYQWKSVLGKDLLQGFVRAEDLDVVKFLLLTYEPADTWAFAAGHYECAWNLWDDFLNQREHDT